MPVVAIHSGLPPAPGVGVADTLVLTAVHHSGLCPLSNGSLLMLLVQISIVIVILAYRACGVMVLLVSVL